MKIGLRGGHSPNCIGAVGYIDEYTECQKIYKRVAELLRAAGHTVIDCNSNGYNANSELAEGTNKANANGVDFFASIHMNAGGGTGCEVWAYNSSSSKAVEIGNRICKNISSQLGITNRGVKYSTGLHDLRCPSAQSIIIESLFVDSKNDCSKFDVEKTARAIANGIDSRVALEEKKAETPIYYVDWVIVYDASKPADKEIAEFMYWTLLGKDRKDTHLLTSEEYDTNSAGDFRGDNITIIGGSLANKYRYGDVLAGSDRYVTAADVYDYLKSKGI